MRALLPAFVFAFSLTGCGGPESKPIGVDSGSFGVRNGTPTTVAAYPNVGVLGVRRSGTNQVDVKCTGTLIAPGIVLTAAHCVRSDGQPIAASNLYFALTESGANLDAADANQRGLQVVEHPAYSTSSQTADLALVRLPATVTRPSYPPLWKEEFLLLPQLTQVRIVGFGQNSSSGGAGTMREGTSVFREELSRPGTTGPLTPRSILRFSPGANSTLICPGDSGGPAFVSFRGVQYLVGVTSVFYASQFQPTCDTGELSGYSSTLVYHDWIRAVLVHTFGIKSILLDYQVFHWSDYLDYNPDLRAAGILNQDQAESHWLSFGVAEGRQAHRGFHVQEYLALYPDLRQAFGNDNGAAIQHFVRNGSAEGRLGLPRHLHPSIYNPFLYAVFNPDLEAAGVVSLAQLKDHWTRFGKNERRLASLEFSAKRYLEKSPDLMALNYSVDQAITHYLIFGRNEPARSPRAVEFDRDVFEATRYLSNNADLRAALEPTLNAAASHWYTNGVNEQRRAGLLNIPSYLTRYPDVRNLNLPRTDGYKAVHHYVNFGRAEGRNPN